MKKTVMICAFVLDESGSMDDSKSGAISGTNEYIKTLKKDRKEHPELGEIYFTLNTFHSDKFGKSVINTIYNMAPIKEVGLISDKNYNPDGGTPYLEAVGKTIESIDKFVAERTAAAKPTVPETGSALAKFIENKGTVAPKTEPDEIEYKIVLVVQTDGGENTSDAAYKPKSKIEAMIAEREKLGNWTFVFLGADMDATSDGISLGANVGNALTYKNSPLQTKQVFTAAGLATSSLRGAVGSSCSVNYASEMKTHLANMSQTDDEEPQIGVNTTSTGTAARSNVAKGIIAQNLVRDFSKSVNLRKSRKTTK